MEFQVSSQEAASTLLYGLLDPSDLNEPNLHKPGSEWDLLQLSALRVGAIDNLSPEQLLPVSFTAVKELPGNLEVQLSPDVIMS
jgi:hypothetical protein